MAGVLQQMKTNVGDYDRIGWREHDWHGGGGSGGSGGADGSWEADCPFLRYRKLGWARNSTSSGGWCQNESLDTDDLGNCKKARMESKWNRRQLRQRGFNYHFITARRSTARK